MTPIGFLGLGIMGTAMARNLLKGGFPVTVWNRTPERCDALVALGATRGESPRAVAAACTTTCAMVSDPAAARALVWGEDGVLPALVPGKSYVDFSTVDPDTAGEIAAAVTSQGARFLEVPVSGSKKPAEDGTLVLLAGGDRSLFDDLAPALSRLGQKALFLGPAGRGAAMKLVVNMIMGEMMVALGEGLALADRAGLAAGDLLEVLDAGAVANPMFRLKGPKVAAGDFGVAFPLKHAQKDLRLALALGDRLAQPLAGAAAANEAFKAARAQGLGELDFSAVCRAVAPTPRG